MTATADNSPTNDPVGNLDRQSLLKAVAALCGTDRVAAELLKKFFKSLVASVDWAAEIKRLERSGVPARYFAGKLRDILNFPGDLVLLRHSEGSFTLLYQMEQRWQYLSENGTPLPDEITVDGEDSFEAVIMKMPQAANRSGGFTSLAALWPELRAAWAEVGIASVFINTGQLLLPLFALLVYDKIAQNGLFETLWALVLGMVLYLATDTGM